MFPGGHPAVGEHVPLGGERAGVAGPERRAARGARAVALAVPPAPRGRPRAGARGRRAPLLRPAHADGN